MTNPYKIEGPAQICFSGGRTSGYMLHHILEANDGLPPDCVVTFENTGKEREETLCFIDAVARAWSVPIHWIEWRGFIEDRPQRFCRFEEVSFATASRNGEPFDALLDNITMMPNPVMRLCTINLKIRLGACYMRSLGYDEFDAVMGIRADEPGRVARMLDPQRDNDAGTPLLPLNTAGVRKADVLSFWQSQPFNLDLDAQGDLGNCDLCFLKARHKIVRAIVDEPARADWWIEAERRFGYRFRANRPSYVELKREAMFWLRQIPLDFNAEPAPVDDEDEALLDCICNSD